MKRLMTGNEAIAHGAWQAGVLFASAYPGTPSSEILANVTRYKEIRSEWAPNEKVALEAAIGASIGGVRSIAAMKHVGVNVAADPLFTYSYMGVNGGMVLITADEPGQHSSQNEQDNRWYALSAKLPMFEPSNSQECLDMLDAAYKLSEDFDSPVLMRVTTRICHSKSIVDCGERADAPTKPYQKNPQKNLMVPAFARQRRAAVEKRMNDLAEYSGSSPFNYIEKGGKIGVIASGMCYHFAKEVFGDSVTYLKLGYTNPLPSKLLAEFYDMVDEVYIIEENDPYLETWVKAQGYACKGKDTFPPYGEMTPDVIRLAVDGKQLPGIDYNRALLVPRPPTLCAGCPHRGFFVELSKLKNVAISGDIGCYTLGFAPPYNAMDTCLCMGGAFSVAHGMQLAFEKSNQDLRAIGILGDSTFFHTGINSLMEVIYNGSKAVSVILDNRITGMTGHQENPGSGKLINGDPAPTMKIVDIVRALGFEHVFEVDPNDLKAVKKAFADALALDGPSVIITVWPCPLKRMDQAERQLYENPFTTRCVVDESKCIGCKLCVRCGCPALSMNRETNVAEIDSPQCVGCDVCAQICPKQAIAKEVR
ncbi:MAG: indolepyruvate ferredoxin oxidoreductase subunit alpha [Defluviitaleaceae bacterium]|nr:indolepyruvate ferredoxin oxidoreductase subunit alpha [Defluviitaleaceae bacterium]